MNKKVLIIGGGVVVLGAIGYLYFTNKKKQDALLSGGTSGAGSTSATPTTGVGASPINSEIPPLSTGGIVTPTTKAPTIQGQEDLDKANDIVVKIKQFQKMSVIKEGQIARWNPTSGLGNFGKPINTYPSAINKLKDDLLKLGYEYKGGIDGVLVKL
jgi:hypothetical protein